MNFCQDLPMRHFLIPVSTLVYSLLAGCASAPNEPTLILETSKTPEQYAQCVMPKLQSHALTPTLVQSQRHSKIVVSSSTAADNVIEAYKSASGGRVFVYERSLLASRFMRTAQECI
jgi:hypothetical protein